MDRDPQFERCWSTLPPTTADFEIQFQTYDNFADWLIAHDHTSHRQTWKGKQKLHSLASKAST